MGIFLYYWQVFCNLVVNLQVIKFLNKYLLYGSKVFQPIVDALLRWSNRFVFLVSILYLLGVVFKFGFVLSFEDLNKIEILNRVTWGLFLIDITINVFASIYQRRSRERKGLSKVLLVLSILLYSTLIPHIFPPEKQIGFFLYAMEFLENTVYRGVLLSALSLIYLSTTLVKTLGKRTNPSLILATSFFTIIIIGAALLMLPRCTYDGISWIDSLFISTSAVCVTGLTPIDVSTTFTTPGLVIIILLIQIGGVGVMTLTSFFAMFFMGNTTLYNQLMVSDMVSSKSISSLFSTLLYILGFTLVIEAIGMFFIWNTITGTMGMSFKEELAFSAFHSISAFCNAGFSTLQGNLGNPLLMNGHTWFYIIISFLIIFGGIGFPLLVNIKTWIHSSFIKVWNFIKTGKYLRNGNRHIISLNSKIVIVTTFSLVFFGTLFIAVLEWNNSLAGMGTFQKITHSFFNAVSPRTAGFNSVDLTTFGVQAVLIYIFLMWIGGAAQSTAGGIKVNAFAVSIMNLYSILRGKQRLECFGRELSTDSIRRSNAAVVSSLAIVFTAVFTLSFLEPDISILNLTFESISALSTVGSSLNVTPLLSEPSKLIVVGLMFIGRVGFVTLIIGLISPKKNIKYRYPKDEIIIN